MCYSVLEMLSSSHLFSPDHRTYVLWSDVICHYKLSLFLKSFCSEMDFKHDSGQNEAFKQMNEFKCVYCDIGLGHCLINCGAILCKIFAVIFHHAIIYIHL